MLFIESITPNKRKINWKAIKKKTCRIFDRNSSYLLNFIKQIDEFGWKSVFFMTKSDIK